MSTSKRIWIFDNMRARSHIFFRLFSQHPQLHQIYHPYVPAGLGACQWNEKLRHSEERSKELQKWRESGVVWLPDDYSYCTKRLRKEIEEAESNGKIVFGNEHLAFCMQHDIMLALMRREKITIPSNPTVFPDDLFDSFTPVLVVRHPALVAPSLWQGILDMPIGCVLSVEDEDYLIQMTLKFSRVMFDLFHKRHGKYPIVVDGDDTVWRYEEMISNVCARLGIDPNGVVDRGWEPVPDEEFERRGLPMYLGRGLLKAFQATTGVKRSEGVRQAVDLDVEQAKWSEKYSEIVAKQLRKRVDAEMEDWQYLVKYKV